jgi:peptide/nickel transport system permease protein
LGVLITAAISAPLGLFLGMLAGYLGRGADLLISRMIDLFFAVPRLILALVFVAILGPGLINAALAVALTSWPIYARVARAETLSFRNAEFIQAAVLQGASGWRILRLHIFPLCFSSMLVRLSLELGGIILSIAAIGFLGLGASPPTPEWGTMAAMGRNFILSHWWVSMMAGIVIFSVALSFNVLGDTIRNHFDPKKDLQWN